MSYLCTTQGEKDSRKKKLEIERFLSEARVRHPNNSPPTFCFAVIIKRKTSESSRNGGEGGRTRFSKLEFPAFHISLEH